MGIEFWILTTDFLGKIGLAVMALRVHEKIRTEQKIDKHVFMSMKREQLIGFGAILLFTISYGIGFL